MDSRNASTDPGSMVSPPANSSEVSSQSTLPSFRAMKPSRLAAMWIVTRESAFAIVLPCHKAVEKMKAQPECITVKHVPHPVNVVPGVIALDLHVAGTKSKDVIELNET